MKNGLSKIGFTLVEILVVISIISILTSVLYFNFNAARESSRDAVRQTDLSQLQLALELYKAQNGRYPEQGCGHTGGWTGAGPHDRPWNNGSSPDSDCDEWIEGLVPEFIAELPEDPNAEQDPNRGFMYRTDNTGSIYKVMVYRTVESRILDSYADKFAYCPYQCPSGACTDATLDRTTTYAVYSAGAECL